MKHLTAIAIKFVMFFLIIWIVLGMMTDLVFSQILAISLLVAGFSYVADLLLVPRINNYVATGIDFVAALAIIYLFNYWANFPYITFVDALVCAVVLAVGEFVYHKFVIKKVIRNVRYET